MTATPTTDETDAATEWRSMATAPKDGTRFLAHNAAEHVFITRYYTEHYSGAHWFSDNYDDQWGDRPRWDNPTRWMPLPTASAHEVSFEDFGTISDWTDENLIRPPSAAASRPRLSPFEFQAAFAAPAPEPRDTPARTFADGIEAAAKEADSYRENSFCSSDRRIARDIATAIRALAKSNKEGMP